MRGFSWILAGVVMAGGAALSARPDTRTLGAVKDNTIHEYSGAVLSDGAGPNLFSGRVGPNANGLRRRALLAFDVTSIPAGSTINSVSLTLQYLGQATETGSRTFSLHRLLADWGEGTSNSFGQGGGALATTGDATWDHRFFSGTLWGANGGDFTPTASASTSVSTPASYTWGSTPQLVADVQQWVNGPGSNLGWILVGDESTVFTIKTFGSRTNSNSAFRPSLLIDFTPIPEPGAMMLAGLAILALLRRRGTC